MICGEKGTAKSLVQNRDGRTGCTNAALGVAACRAVLANTLAMVLAHMDGWLHRGDANKGSRHGVMANAGKSGMARQGNADQAM